MALEPASLFTLSFASNVNFADNRLILSLASLQRHDE